MGYLKFSENMFLEVAEFKRLQKFLDKNGIKRHTLINTDTFGLVRQAVLPQIGSIELADSFYVAKAGTPFDNVIVNPGIAVDSDANLIINTKSQNLQVPNDGLWYWLKIKHKFDVKENGVVSIDTLGNMTGVGTEFTEILRGQPNYPAKIKFLNSTTGNANIYEVVKVVSDTSVILQGDFTAEQDLEFGVYGTFTPGYPVPTDDQMIFQYDSVEIEMTSETVLGQAPNYLLNKEFYIARVRNNGVDVTLQDKRINWWETEAMAYLKQIDRSLENPLIGVEAVKYDIGTSTRAKNLVELAWGFRTDKYTIDTSSKKISILIGEGGVYKDTSHFQSGDFNDWRLYAKNGSWRTIIDSQKTGTQIVITLDVLEPSEYSMSTLVTSDTVQDEIFIAPPFESIEFRFREDANPNVISVATLDEDIDNENWPILENKYIFNINTPLARVSVPSLDGCYKYNLTYRLKIFNEYTDWQVMPDDIIGYYDETSFDKRGNLNDNQIDRVRVPYEGHLTYGFIKICENPNSFNNFQEYIDTGDLFGVNTTEFANSTPTLNLVVGESKRYQHFKGQELALSADMYIHLNRKNVDGDDFREGNTFYIHIEQWINLSTFKMRIVEDFVDPTNYTELADIDVNDMMYVRNNTVNNPIQNLRRGLFIVCTYNEFNHWIVSYDTEICPKGIVRMAMNIPANTFDSSGNGQKQGFWGWKIVNEMDNVFPVGTLNTGASGSVGGDNSVTLNENNMPKHTHTVNDPGHTHDVTIKQGIDDHSSGRHSNSRIDRDRTYTTARSYTGITLNPSGSINPSAIDKRPKRMKFLFIEKIV